LFVKKFWDKYITVDKNLEVSMAFIQMKVQNSEQNDNVVGLANCNLQGLYLGLQPNPLQNFEQEVSQSVSAGSELY